MAGGGGIQHRFWIPLAVVIVLYGAGIQLLLLRCSEERHERTFLVVDVLIAVLVVLGSISLLRHLSHAATLRFAGPIPLPIVGNLLSLVTKENVQESFRDLHKKYGTVVDLLLVEGQRVVIVNDAAFCKQAMKSMDRGDLSIGSPTAWQSDFRQRFLWQELYGYHYLDLFTRTDTVGNWQAHRKILQPAFDQRHVRAMASNIETAARNLAAALPDDPNKVVDVLPLLQDYGLDMIFSTSLGKRIHSIPDRGRSLAAFLDAIMAQFSAYQFDPFLYWTVNILPVLGLNAAEIQRRKDVIEFRSFCRGIVVEEIERQRQQCAKQDNIDAPDKDNLLSLMVASMNDDHSFGVENVIDELGSFIFAGYDTTKVSLGNLFYHLASNLDAQRKVQKEIDRNVVGKSGSLENFNDMPFLSACIRESQRLQPIAPALSRRTHKDISIFDSRTGSPIVVPKGTFAYIPIFLLHRDPTVYPNPESFEPQRWIREGKDNSSELLPTTPGYFYAFGGGPKMCVGFQLAEKEVKMAAALVLKEFDIIDAGEPVKIVDHFVTGPDKVMLRFKKRLTAT